MSTKTNTYLSAFERLDAHRSHEPVWLRATRRAAAATFERLGFPTTRDEEWRFTNVAPIAQTSFGTAEPADLSRTDVGPFAIPGAEGPILVFVDGRYAPHASSPGPGGPIVTSIVDALAKHERLVEPHLGRHVVFTDRAFAAMNTALFEDGAFVAIPDDRVVEAPIQLLFLSTDSGAATACYPRALVVAGRNSQARIIETYAALGRSRGFTNAVTEIVVGPGAVVDHYRLQRDSETAFHIGHTQFQLDRSSTASSHALSFGGLIARHEAVAVLNGEGADCTLNGLYLADGVRLIDNHTEIDHAMPHGSSHEVYKGILAGRARGVFNGRIRVRPDAQKTDAKQTNKTLLLSDDAQVNTKPQLEIFANDVKCTHGATVGQLSEDALFYLRTRGIGEDDARSLLVRAFATDVTGRMAFEPVRAEVDRLLAAKLPGTLAEKAFA